jgi:hypothetical protein
MQTIRDNMSRNRYQNIISRESDASIVDDYWFKQYQKMLDKNAVQPLSKTKSIYDQISAIINKKSKFPSVEAAVKDMQERSGIIAYWEKLSKKSNVNLKKADVETTEPEILKKFPNIKKTLENYIRDTKGNLDLPAIIEKVKTIHKLDGPQSKDWEDENFIRFVYKMNFDEKSKYDQNSSDFANLGKLDRDNDIDPANTDAFFGLMPYKI